VPFGRDLARLASRSISGELLLEAAANAAQSVTTPEELQDVGIVRSAFKKVVTAVEASPSLTEQIEPIEPTEPIRIDRHLVWTLREMHQTVARLTFLSELAATGEPAITEVDAPANLIEAEVVAIYW
jgi:hypothetical protein